MGWRVALIDSCGSWPGAADAAAFVSEGGRVERRPTAADSSGHGSRIVQVLAGGDAAFELLLGQVFLDTGPTSAAAVAAAIDWAVTGGADLIHMSLGLQGDRAVLAEAVQRAMGLGSIIVAAAPARGAGVYPADYAQVIRATGDARCAPGELSHLGPEFFGGCPRFVDGASKESITHGDADDVVGRRAGGASIGAAWVTRNILCGPKYTGAGDLAAALATGARYFGPERKGAHGRGLPALRGRR